MDNKPTDEQLKNFQEHIGWRYLKEWIEKRIEDIKESLLHTKDFEMIKKLQTEYETYKSIINKVRSGK